ncbi:MAG: hypothetical protein ABIN25_08065 [Ginsengibacter sp.]
MGLDSVKLLMEVEKHFGICIPDQEAEKARSVGNLVDCVANILGIKFYDFSLRDRTFSLLKAGLLGLKNELKDCSINSKVTDSLDIQDKFLINELENKINLKLPDIYFKPTGKQRIVGRLREWFNSAEAINFDNLKWK